MKKNNYLKLLNTINFLLMVILFQSCTPTKLSPNFLKSVDANKSLNQPVAPTPSINQNNCNLNGQTIAHNGVVTVYATSTVPAGQTCASQVRTCSNGNLSGSYTSLSCTVASVVSPPPSASCGAMPSGYAANICQGFYQNSNNASLISYCQCVNAPPVSTTSSCNFNGVTVAHNSTITGYLSAIVPNGSTCSSQVKTCDNGTLSYSNYASSTCTVQPPASTPPVDSEAVTCTDKPVDNYYVMNGSNPGGNDFYPAFYSANKRVFAIRIEYGPYMKTIGTKYGYPNFFAWHTGNGIPVGRTIVFSPCRGDFTSSNVRFLQAPGHALKTSGRVSPDGELGIWFDEPLKPYPDGERLVITLPSSRIWYMNIKNTDCPLSGTICQLTWDFQKAPY